MHACFDLTGRNEIGEIWPFCEGGPSGGVSYARICRHMVRECSDRKGRGETVE